MSRRDLRAEKSIARKLINEDGLTVTAVANRLGVSDSIICRWAKAEGWVLASRRDRDFKKALEPLLALREEPAVPLPDGFDLTSIATEKMKAVSENLIRTCISMLMKTKSERAVIKVLEQAVKLYLGLEVWKSESCAMFQVLVPPIIEQYGGQEGLKRDPE
ncbi:MAG TPA: hypothetical protein VIV61_04745 [Candidatus Ozemobacteraceae bacterium]